MKKFIMLLLVCLVSISAGEQKKSQVVAKISNKSFTLEEFQENLNQMQSRFANLNYDMKKRILDQFVREKLFTTAAKDAGVNLTSEQEKYLERSKTMFLIRNYISKILSENPVTDTDIKQAYEKNPQAYLTPERRKLRHIIVPDEEKAKQLLNKLKEGADFAELARENNTDATKQKGGDLGWAQKGIFVKEFEDVAFSLKKGETSGIVKTQFGYHIIRVDDIEQPKQRSFNEVQQEIKRKLEEQKIQQIEQQLKKKYKVQVDYSVLEDAEKK
ncbi:MAG TPA: peptidylprolyl isomerase [bacterium]|nr:peptidylprolyl isomerase [bacterium]HOL35051.1 peptidylprolyl isomerase [bacterium]HPP08412.1 peptidylprolyl isomerase [bacterium]